jgi:hypothetical protein
MLLHPVEHVETKQGELYAQKNKKESNHRDRLPSLRRGTPPQSIYCCAACVAALKGYGTNDVMCEAAAKAAEPYNWPLQPARQATPINSASSSHLPLGSPGASLGGKYSLERCPTRKYTC